MVVGQNGWHREKSLKPLVPLWARGFFILEKKPSLSEKLGFFCIRRIKMKRVLASEISQFVGQMVNIQGWVHRCRTLGQLMFVIVRDRTGLIQTVLEGDLATKSELSNECVVSMNGYVHADERAMSGVELRVAEVEVLSHSERILPFEVNAPKSLAKERLDTLLEHRALSVRRLDICAIFRVQAEIIAGFRDFLQQNGFTEIQTPKIVVSATEGGAELFPIQYFEQPAFLAQSPQLYKQIMVGSGFERVFEVGKAYRAENHNTARHINEFVSLDYEMGFINDENDVIQMEVELLKYLFERVAYNCANEIEMLGATAPQITDIPKIKLHDAKAILAEHYGKQYSQEKDLDPEGERLLCKYVRFAHRRLRLTAHEKYGVELIYVTHYPRFLRPMYTMPDEKEPNLTRSFDLLFRGLEVTTGGQRIHQYDRLVFEMQQRGIDPTNFEFYLETFRYGMPPHGGLAIGAERLTMQLLSLQNIREASLFPRDRTRLTP
jgi:nondiscriminating aspartyl-tRNA synthetase